MTQVKDDDEAYEDRLEEFGIEKNALDWFIDFGPTRAKQDGRAPYLTSKIWSLFPDRLDNKVQPEGWGTFGLMKMLSSFVSATAQSRSNRNLAATRDLLLPKLMTRRNPSE